jgi:hypothetical protein
MSDESRAYQRGYSAGVRKYWNLHKPPIPPDPIVGDLVRAAQVLRDTVDGECAKFEKGDEMAERLYVGVDAVDEAMKRLSLWLLESSE